MGSKTAVCVFLSSWTLAKSICFHPRNKRERSRRRKETQEEKPRFARASNDEETELKNWRGDTQEKKSAACDGPSWAKREKKRERETSPFTFSIDNNDEMKNVDEEREKSGSSKRGTDVRETKTHHQ